MNYPNPATAVQVTSLLRPTSVSQFQFDIPTPGTNRIHFQGPPGTTYHVLFSTDLMLWNCVGAVTADPSTGSFQLDYNWNSAPRGFYRSTP
jgi:hypothetical protein